MTRNKWVLSSAALLILAGSATAWCAPKEERRAEIVRTEGTVEYQRAGTDNWFKVNKKVNLYAGDHVRTGKDSKADIEMDGNLIRLWPNVHVIVPSPPEKKKSAIEVLLGKLAAIVTGKHGIDIFSPGVVAGAEGTKFIVEVEEGGRTTLTVIEGEVAFHNDLGRVVVQAGEQSVAGPNLAPSRPTRVDPSGAILWEASLDALRLGIEMRYHPTRTREALGELLDQAQQAAADAPDEPALQMDLGDVLQDLGRLNEAEEAYRKALDLAPDSLDAQLRIGLNLLLQVRPLEAEEVFAAAREVDPAEPQAMIGLAAAALTSGRENGLAEAGKAVSAALAVSPNAPLAHVVAGLIAVREGKADAAHDAFARAISLDPNTYQAHAHLSGVLLAQGEGDAALEAAHTAAALAPASGLALESLATAEFFAGRLEDAATHVALALEYGPGSPNAHLVASDIYVAEGDLDAGLREAQAAVALDPLLGTAYSAIGMIALAQDDLAEADHAFSKALRFSPGLVAARTGMGVTYARQGKLGKAMEMQKAAIALDSTRAAVLSNRGAIHLAEGDLQDAVRDFQAAIDIQPEWSLPHANLAIAYLDLNRFADAVRAGERAVKLGEKSGRVHTTLARVYLEQDRTNKAWAALREALELDPDYALAHLEMAEVYGRMGRWRDALKQQLEGIVLNPAAMLESREYSRTEARVAVGSFHGAIKTDGRGDDGNLAYYLEVAHEDDDGGRRHSDFQRTTAVGVAGRQVSKDRADALYFTWQREERDLPGAELAGGLPEDPNYQSSFAGQEVHYLTRRSAGNHGALTVKVGYRDAALKDFNPDSLAPDLKPFPRMKIRFDGLLAEARYDRRVNERSSLVAGVAVSGEDREVSGVLGTVNPPGAADPLTWTPFADKEDSDAATFYGDYETKLSTRTDLLIGGRLVTRSGMSPVYRPRAVLKRDVGGGGKLVLLTRPILRDDVSEISSVDDWALRDSLSPLDLGMGGFSQSYELQYQLMPANGSLLRVSAFHRDLKNYIVDMTDPRWAPGQVGNVLASGTLTGAEVEWEHWLGRDLSAGLWLRYTDSENDGARGRKIPYQPDLSGRLRLDYIDQHGVRAGVGWLHVGKRYADTQNTVRLGGYGVVNLWAAKQFDLHTGVFLTVENLLDKDCEFWQDYPCRGREVRAGVEFRF